MTPKSDTDSTWLLVNVSMPPRQSRSASRRRARRDLKDGSRQTGWPSNSRGIVESGRLSTRPPMSAKQSAARGRTSTSSTGAAPGAGSANSPTSTEITAPFGNVLRPFESAPGILATPSPSCGEARPARAHLVVASRSRLTSLMWSFQKARESRGRPTVLYWSAADRSHRTACPDPPAGPAAPRESECRIRTSTF